MGSAQAKAIRQLEFVAELRRFQVLAQMSQTLLEREQSGRHSFCVCMRNIAPHGIWTGTEPCHFTQSASTDGAKILVVGEFVFEQCAQGRRDELRKMTHPCA